MEDLLQLQYVVLTLGREYYALRIYDIYEIIKMQKITEIPNSRSYLDGVINLRGKIIPVVSLRKRFGLPEVEPTKSSRIVVVNLAEEFVGIVVDSVTRVTKFADIQAPPEAVSGLEGGYFEGLGHAEEGLVSILKIDRVLQE